jgi:beta-lactamase regulating signal transducer with metallopeptidase domain
MLFCVLSLSGKEGSNVTDEAIAVRLENHEQEIKSLKHRMDEREEKDKTLSELTTSVRTLAVNMEYMAKEQQKQGERLERLEHEPTDEYKHYKRLIIGCIITTVIGTVLGAILANVL